MTAPGQPLPSQDFCGTAALHLKPDIARRTLGIARDLFQHGLPRLLLRLDKR